MDGYSRLVQFLKVLLPLAALGLLSSVFLLSRSVDPNATIPFAQQELDQRTSGQQVTAPFFSGVTEKGEEIFVTASLARPGSETTPAQAEDLSAEIRLDINRKITLNSDMGEIRLDQDMAVFSGDVVIISTDGIRVTTEELNTSLSGVSGYTPGPVAGTGPIGEFKAGRLEFGAENEDDPIHMLFKNGVKLIYDPQKPER